MKNDLYYFDSEVAALLNITLNRLRNKVSAGDYLPPRIEPLGCRQRLWPKEQFHEWLEMHTVMSTKTTPVLRLTKQKSKLVAKREFKQ